MFGVGGGGRAEFCPFPLFFVCSGIFYAQNEITQYLIGKHEIIIFSYQETIVLKFIKQYGEFDRQMLNEVIHLF